MTHLDGVNEGLFCSCGSWGCCGNVLCGPFFLLKTHTRTQQTLVVVVAVAMTILFLRKPTQHRRNPEKWRQRRQGTATVDVLFFGILFSWWRWCTIFAAAAAAAVPPHPQPKPSIVEQPTWWSIGTTRSIMKEYEDQQQPQQQQQLEMLIKKYRNKTWRREESFNLERYE